MFWYVTRFARVRIEDSSFNRFALNGIQRDFFGGIFSEGIFSGGILSGYPTRRDYHSGDYHSQRRCTTTAMAAHAARTGRQVSAVVASCREPAAAGSSVGEKETFVSI